MILMLNCSYKAKNGNTQHFLELLKENVIAQSTALDKDSVARIAITESDVEIASLKNVLNGGLDDFNDKLAQADAFVIGAPLYVDGLPAQAVRLLEMLLETDKERFVSKPVYVVSNLGFYEAEQITPLLEIVRNWCSRMQMVYGGGFAIGAGPLVRPLKSVPCTGWLHKDVKKGIGILADAIAKQRIMDNYYAKTKLPRAAYLNIAHISFKKQMKENGV